MLLGGGCSNTGSDTLYIKKLHINGVGHSRDEKILQLYTILVVPWVEIYVLEALRSSKIHCPGNKNLCMGVSSFSLSRKLLATAVPGVSLGIQS